MNEEWTFEKRQNSADPERDWDWAILRNNVSVGCLYTEHDAEALWAALGSRGVPQEAPGVVEQVRVPVGKCVWVQWLNAEGLVVGAHMVLPRDAETRSVQPAPCPHCGLFGNHLSSCEYEKFAALRGVGTPQEQEQRPVEKTEIESKSVDLHPLDDDPFRGELSIYRNGQWIMGINEPFIEPVLAAIRSALPSEFFLPDDEGGANDEASTQETPMISERPRKNTNDFPGAQEASSTTVPLGPPHQEEKAPT